MRDYISATQIGQFLYCPLSYKFIYVDELLPRDPPTVYTLWGSAMHEALAHNYRQKIKSKKDLPAKEIIQVFTEYFEKELPNVENPSYFGRRADPIVMVATGENVLHDYMEKIAPTIQPLMVEQEFKIKLKSRPITIKGYIDLVDINGLITDHKTCGKSTMKKWTEAEVESSVQLSMYAIAYRKLFNKKEAGVAIGVIPRMDNPKFKTIIASRSDADLNGVIEIAYAITQMTKNNTWYPNPSSCASCSFSDTCTRKNN